MDPKDTTYEKMSDASHEAVHAARDAAQAVEFARQQQSDRSAEAAVVRVTDSIGDILQTRMEHVLSRGTEQDKSIILARVPYICQDIKSIKSSLKEIADLMKQSVIDSDKKYVNQDQFWPIRSLAYGGAGLILTAVVGALVALVITK